MNVYHDQAARFVRGEQWLISRCTQCLFFRCCPTGTVRPAVRSPWSFGPTSRMDFCFSAEVKPNTRWVPESNSSSGLTNRMFMCVFRIRRYTFTINNIVTWNDRPTAQVVYKTIIRKRYVVGHFIRWYVCMWICKKRKLHSKNDCDFKEKTIVFIWRFRPRTAKSSKNTRHFLRNYLENFSVEFDGWLFQSAVSSRLSIYIIKVETFIIISYTVRKKCFLKKRLSL